jgi:hypothetical protein
MSKLPGQPTDNAMDRARARSTGWARRMAPAAWLLAGLLLAALLVAWPAIAIYFALACLPTLAMALVDDDSDRRGTVCVGTLNMAGALPFVLLAVTGQLGGNPLLFAPAYFFPILCAAIGFGLYTFVPLLAKRLAKIEEDAETTALGERQQALVEEWGANVATVKLNFDRNDG